MKKLVYIFILTLLIAPSAFSKSINLPGGNSLESVIVNKLESFIKEKKFQADATLMYPGINSKQLKTKLTELINESAKDFMEIASGNPTDEKYQAKIKSGLERVDPYYSELTSEDLDMIYHYYEQLIEIVGLKNPGNHLKKWRYGSTASGK